MVIAPHRNIAWIFVLLSTAFAVACTKDEAAEPVAPESTTEETSAEEGDAAEATAEDATSEDAPDITGTEESPTADASEEDVGIAEESAATPQSPTPVPQSQGTSVDTTGATVWYVKSSATGVYDAPGGKQVASLRKGDHILVVVDGEWAKVHDGTWIRAKDLSQKPIGRTRPKAAKWR